MRTAEQFYNEMLRKVTEDLKRGLTLCSSDKGAWPEMRCPTWRNEVIELFKNSGKFSEYEFINPCMFEGISFLARIAAEESKNCPVCGGCHD